MRKCIVYTKKDGGVSICWPAKEAISWMGCGGYWGNCQRGWLDRQIELSVIDGRDEDAARRFVHAMQFGGCSTSEALEIIRDRDCAHLGTAIELWDADDVPADRWFRNAWRRSHNGGPIMIDLKAAKSIQWQRINHALTAENERRRNDVELWGEVDVDLPAIRQKILKAADEFELRHIWPVI